MKKIPLSKNAIKNNGYFALVDDDDYGRLKDYRWSISIYKGGTIRVSTILKDNKRKLVSMKDFIVGGLDVRRPVIFKDGNRLNFRRSNLIRTTSKGRHAISKAHGSTSKYKGVSYYQKKRFRKKISGEISTYIQKGWRVFIAGKHVGCFEKEKEAALAYDKAAKKYYGKSVYLNLNFPDKKKSMTTV
jgi:hypothetical protein